MTNDEWLTLARRDAAVLRDLIREFHPVNRQPERRPEDRITAAAAEEACTHVRKQIRENFEGDPVVQFDSALEHGDIGRLNTLLNDAWFGVPESTSSWRIPGFREAVNLMDEMPDDES